MTTSAPLVLGFTGENANATLAGSTDGLNRLLTTRGIEAHRIDTDRPDWSERLREFVTSRPILFAYGYAGVGSILRNGNQSFWTAFKTPFLSLMYDHPFYNLPNHMVDSPYVANCYFVADYAEARKKFVPRLWPDYVLREGFTPTTGDHLARGHWAKRGIQYLFAKSGGDNAKMNAAIAALPNAEQELFRACIKELQASPEWQITELVKTRANELSKGAFGRMVVLLDRYMRDWRSRQIVEYLKHKPTLIIGNGWDDIDKTNAQAKFLSARPIAEVEAMYRDTKFVFNASPYSRDGYHERVTMALNNGAVAVSDRNRFSDQNFASLSNFVGFDFADPQWGEKLDAKLMALEKDPSGLDPAAAQAHLRNLFPVDGFVENLVHIASTLRRQAAGNP